jgi:DNA-directed RNA polymerase beta subunit
MVFADVLQSFEKENGWVKFQIESYNHFIKFGMQSIIEEIDSLHLNPEGGEFKLKFGQVEIGSPHIKEADGSIRSKERSSPVFPNEARIRNLTYAAPVWVTITPIINGIQDKPEKVYIGDMPVMVKSNNCSTHGMTAEELIEKGEDPSDPGGYFIVNGTERVVVLIEEIAPNKPIYEKSKGEIMVRLNSEKSGFRQRHLIERKADGEITISFANLRGLSIITLLKALGIETDKEICDKISKESAILNDLYVNLYQEEAATTKEAIDVIGKKLRVADDYKDERVKQILDRYLLPHVGQETKDRLEKAEVLSKIVEKVILMAMNKIPDDDIDHYGNKRLLMSGELLGQLFRSILLGRWGLLAKMTYNYQKLVKRGKHPNIQGIVEADAVTKQIVSSLATGNWIGGRTGVSQRLDRSSFIKTISHLRSIVSPLTSTQEHFRARQVHPTEWGRLCPAETPEGSSIGLRKHIAMLTQITPGLSVKETERVLATVTGK